MGEFFCPFLANSLQSHYNWVIKMGSTLMANDYKSWVSGVFDRSASQYGTKGSSFFNYFGERLVEQSGVCVNQRILDVATGRGAVLFPLAKAVGPLGKVIGIDISPQMIRESTQEAKEKGVDWVHLQCMDAEQLAFADHSFDAVFCGFSLFFFPALSQALSEFKRVLKPGGTLAVSTWGKKPELAAWVREEAKKLVHSGDLAATSLFDSNRLRICLENAHFNSIQIVEETKTFLHSTPEEWWESLWAHGTRASLEPLSDEQIISLREKAIEKAGCLEQGHGMPEELQVFYGFAKKS
jgi:ubiquinone/menaquinone biosynthesis C-methylase UbiE